jgi:hypothetical protein
MLPIQNNDYAYAAILKNQDLKEQSHEKVYETRPFGKCSVVYPGSVGFFFTTWFGILILDDSFSGSGQFFGEIIIIFLQNHILSKLF